MPSTDLTNLVSELNLDLPRPELAEIIKTKIVENFNKENIPNSHPTRDFKSGLLYSETIHGKFLAALDISLNDPEIPLPTDQNKSDLFFLKFINTFQDLVCTETDNELIKFNEELNNDIESIIVPGLINGMKIIMYFIKDQEGGKNALKFTLPQMAEHNIKVAQKTNRNPQPKKYIGYIIGNLSAEALRSSLPNFGRAMMNLFTTAGAQAATSLMVIASKTNALHGDDGAIKDVTKGILSRIGMNFIPLSQMNQKLKDIAKLK